MKFLKLMSFFMLVGTMSLVSCKSDSASEDAARESLVKPATTGDVKATPVNANKPAEPIVPVGPLTSMKFDEMEFDFGDVMEGEKVEHEYTFTNTGSEPLIISNAKPSCGCTVSNWTKEPVAPGESGFVKVVFDSKGKGKVGGNLQTKTVTITANTDPVTTYIRIKGKVNKEETPAS